MSEYNLFRDASDLQGYLFRITDNGGATLDRYTVVFSDGTSLTLSSNLGHPQGVSIFNDFPAIDVNVLDESVKNGEQVDLALGDLPENVVTHIVTRLNEAYKDYIESIKERNSFDVAPSRGSAAINQGVHDDTGIGIYWSDEDNAYRIRRELDYYHDGGPYETARDALYATLPDIHGLSGPEYHSTVDDLMRMESSEAVADKVKELESRVDSGNDFRV